MSTGSVSKLNSDAKDKSASEAQEVLVEERLDIASEVPTFENLLPEQLQPYWQLVEKYPALEAGIIFTLFLVLAYLVRLFAVSIISKLASHTKNNLDDQIVDALKPPIFKIIVAFGIIIASRSAGYVEGWAQYIAPIVLTWVVLSLTRAALKLSSTIISALSRDPNRFHTIDVRTEPLLIIVSKIVILIICAYMVLVIWGINPVGLLASAGIVGIAVGFAAKDTLANLFSGVFILADRPYKLGDYVNLDGGERGKVTHIGIRSTRILTRDDIEITVPNGVIGNAKVINESGGLQHRIRIRLNVQCAYEADLEEVFEVLIKVAKGQEKLCKHPTPIVRVVGFGESGIDLQLRGWIDEPQDRGLTQHLLYMEIHRAFKEHNLEIPYPKRDLNITGNAS